jgi:lipopolysaccharide assembly outer membrane protein LptD (OstA)
LTALKPTLSLVVLLAAAATAGAQEIPRNCDLDFVNKPGNPANVTTDATGKRITYLGGGIIAHCIGQGNTLTADSAQYYESEARLYLVGNVHYTEPRAKVDSHTMTYYQNDDHLHAEGDVVAVQLAARSAVQLPITTAARLSVRSQECLRRTARLLR